MVIAFVLTSQFVMSTATSNNHKGSPLGNSFQSKTPSGASTSQDIDSKILNKLIQCSEGFVIKLKPNKGYLATIDKAGGHRFLIGHFEKCKNCYKLVNNRLKCCTSSL